MSRNSRKKETEKKREKGMKIIINGFPSLFLIRSAATKRERFSNITLIKGNKT